MRGAGLSRALRAGALAFAVGAGLSAPAAGQSPRIETWVGAEAFQRAWSLYSGVTIAPAASIQEDGLRLRAVVGQGQYRTSSGNGISPFAEALAGYQMQAGPVTVKAFAGAIGLANLESAEDLANFWALTQIGPKAGLETWWTVNDGAWVSLDLAWSQPRQIFYSRLRAAFRPVPQVSLGLEGGAVGNVSELSLRAGPFLRYEWPEGEVSLSGGLSTESAPGWSGAILNTREPAGYVTLNWLSRF